MEKGGILDIETVFLPVFKVLLIICSLSVEGHAALTRRSGLEVPIWDSKAGICIHCNRSLLIHFL